MIPAGLVGTIHWLEDVFEGLKLGRSYGGAIAYNYYGPPRLTQDVDVLALIPAIQSPALIEALAGGGCLLGDVDPKPLDVKAALAELRGRGHMVTLVRQGIRIEIFAPWHPFHSRVLERSPERVLDGRTIRIHSAEDLIVFKKIFDRPKDIMDIKAMLLAQKGRLNTARLLSDAKGLLADADWKELEDLITRYA
ncbi:MAG: hypothetical protein AAB339_00970 [Elusimicrobiota bacterium]